MLKIIPSAVLYSNYDMFSPLRLFILRFLETDDGGSDDDNVILLFICNQEYK